MDMLIKDSEYKQWLGELKQRIRQSQIKAAIKVNSELLHLYWDLGHDIVVQQMDAAWEVVSLSSCVGNYEPNFRI